MTNVAGLRAGGGRFQTFTSSGGIVASRTQFPDGIHIIFWTLPDDDPCTIVGETSRNHTKRQKSVQFEVFTHATIAKSWYIFLITGAIISVLIFGLTLLALKIIDRNLDVENNSGDFSEVRLLEDNEELINTTTPRRRFTEGGLAVLSGLSPTNCERIHLLQFSCVTTLVINVDTSEQWDFLLYCLVLTIIYSCPVARIYIQ
ncbi:hypothetical protein SK128_016815 [Halocaridina rubra]|uniref:Uncharacterized protein n=1 Tax=Halocaridina rubra TaxID=373956 RepID=A0AAN8XJ33_HALRR